MICYFIFLFTIHALFLFTLCFSAYFCQECYCAHPSVLFLVCTSKDASWGLYHVSVSSLVHRSKAKHQYDHHHSPPRVSVRRACIPEVSHDQQCMRLTQGLKERLFVHFQSEESIDAAGVQEKEKKRKEKNKKMIGTWSKLNLAVYSKKVDGSNFSHCSS